MSRIALTDNSGKWFSTETAEVFNEEKFWNGNNMISKATGSQTEHEKIYRTKGGKFILVCFSDWQGSKDTVESISAEEAAVWFSKNEIDPHPACKKEFAALEIE